MGKSVGFIGNFKGKLGNAIGYKVSQSNSGTNQGVRVYQPNIKNTKSAAQAEQRAKYAPIFATYRALKMIIDRGNESKPYGNASRIAWLKKAFYAEEMPWITKGSPILNAVGCPISFGSLFNFNHGCLTNGINMLVPHHWSDTDISTIGKMSTEIMNSYPLLKIGDQISVVGVGVVNGTMVSDTISFIVNPTDTTPSERVNSKSLTIWFEYDFDLVAGAIILSREGSHGEHLRSNSVLKINSQIDYISPYTDADKQAAIASYMATDSANADWAEESIQ